MKKILSFLFALLSVASVWAYESDSHLRISYILARAAGLSDQVAKYLSIGNQYVDETATTSAMLLSSQRQLYHFHGDAAFIKQTGHGGTSLWSRIFKSKLSLAERNHALGSIFIYHGLVKGDLQILAAGTHTKMDTFGHAGFSNFLGHAPDGHSPDRAFLEPKKYEDMIRELVATYTALRKVLPAEMLDDAGALEYLNKLAPKTHYQRKLTAADLNDAIIVSTVLTSDTELQGAFREDMYRKYEYKKIALERIYETFKESGKINADVTFNDLFPDELIRNPSFDTMDVVKYTLIKNAQSEFLKTLSGKDIFDLPKLLEGQTEESFLRRFNMEVRRYEARLRELDQMERNLEELKVQSAEERAAREVQLAVLEADFNEALLKLRAEHAVAAAVESPLMDAAKADQREARLALAEATLRQQHELNRSQLLDVSDISLTQPLKALTERVAQEQLRLLSGLGDSAVQIEVDSEGKMTEAFVKARALELAQLKMAEEMANHLTKDFIPRQKNEYIKHQFEGEYENRSFEKRYKDEVYRRYIHKHFGVNWVFEEGKSKFVKVWEAIKNFKAMMTGKVLNAPVIERWKIAAEKAAQDLIRDNEVSDREKAHAIGFNSKNKRTWFWKHLSYVAQASPLIYGYYFMGKLSSLAKKFAHDHMSEDMEAAVRDGKYKANVLGEKTAAYGNVQELKAGAVYRCSNLMAKAKQ